MKTERKQAFAPAGIIFDFQLIKPFFRGIHGAFYIAVVFGNIERPFFRRIPPAFQGGHRRRCCNSPQTVRYLPQHRYTAPAHGQQAIRHRSGFPRQSSPLPGHPIKTIRQGLDAPAGRQAEPVTDRANRNIKPFFHMLFILFMLFKSFTPPPPARLQKRRRGTLAVTKRRRAPLPYKWSSTG